MVFEQLTFALDIVLSPITALPTPIAILIISAGITGLLLVLSKLLVNKNMVKEIRAKMEETRENLTKAQKEGNKENVQKFLDELMKTNNQYMKQTFKTMIISLIVVSIFLPWLGYKYQGLTVAVLPFSLPFIGSQLPWLYWYFLVSLMVGWTARKLVGSVP